MLATMLAECVKYFDYKSWTCKSLWKQLLGSVESTTMSKVLGKILGSLCTIIVLGNLATVFVI